MNIVLVCRGIRNSIENFVKHLNESPGFSYDESKWYMPDYYYEYPGANNNKCTKMGTIVFVKYS